jgi:hypothetical protein
MGISDTYLGFGGGLQRWRGRGWRDWQLIQGHINQPQVNCRLSSRHSQRQTRPNPAEQRRGTVDTHLLSSDWGCIECLEIS